MSTGNNSSTLFKTPQVGIALADGAAPKRVQLLRIGTYHDPRYGEFEVTEKTLASMKKNFDAKVLKIDPAIDYAHESNQKAAGWIEALELADDGKELWASQVKWTPDGAKVLADREFRYLSADFTDDYIDNETLKHYGPTLRGAGLTNRPVIKGMSAAVQLQEGNMDMAKLDELEAQIKKLSESNEALTKKLDEVAAAAKDDGDNKDDDGDEPEGDMTPEEAKKKMAEMATEMADHKKKLAEYEKKFGKLEQEKQAAEKKSAFDKQLSEGRVCEAQREPYMNGDMIKFSELAKPVNLVGKGHSNDPVIADADVDSKIIAAADKMLADRKVKTQAEGMSKVLAENTDGLRVAKYGK